MKRNREGKYFKRVQGAPEDLVIRLERRVKFNEVDIMGIVWFGRYPVYFEEGSAELGRLCGLTYENFKKAGLQAPAVGMKVNYHKPLYLDEEFIIQAQMVWTDAAKINTEYKLIKKDNTIAATGALIQLIIDEKGETCFVIPELLENARRIWKKGAFKCQKD